MPGFLEWRKLPGSVRRAPGDCRCAPRAIATAGALEGGPGVACNVELIRPEHSHHVHECGQRPHGVRAPAEAKQINAVAIPVVRAEKTVGAEYMVIESQSGCKAEEAFQPLREPGPWILLADGADAGVVPDQLAFAFLDDPEKLQDVGDHDSDLVPGTVAADDDVATGPHSRRLCH